jgi:ABC-type Zn uptake system ZnuABC Zn-binding protein ZnuA
MGKIENVQIEYERLKSLFSSVDPTKTELVDNLINEAAFMKVQLSNLQEQIKKHGAVQISTKGNQRQTESAKYYTKLVNSYGTVIKTLNSIMGKNVMDEDDEFDKFMAKMSE